MSAPVYTRTAPAVELHRVLRTWMPAASALAQLMVVAKQKALPATAAACSAGAPPAAMLLKHLSGAAATAVLAAPLAAHVIGE